MQTCHKAIHGMVDSVLFPEPLNAHAEHLQAFRSDLPVIVCDREWKGPGQLRRGNNAFNTRKNIQAHINEMMSEHSDTVRWRHDCRCPAAEW